MGIAMSEKPPLSLGSAPAIISAIQFYKAWIALSTLTEVDILDDK
jgi:hypothetical protein